jgi:hypothetical protein
MKKSFGSEFDAETFSRSLNCAVGLVLNPWAKLRGFAPRLLRLNSLKGKTPPPFILSR